jgi:glutamate-1-semialdehyde 2,1-aminomutase
MTSRLSPGGLQEKLGIEPDLTSLGKYIGGGFSCGALGGRDELMSMFDLRRENGLSHAGTFNNNIASMIGGSIGLGKYFTGEACVSLNARGDKLRERLNEIAKEANTPVQVTGIGSVMNPHLGLEIIKSPDDINHPNLQLFRMIMHLHMINRGFYVASRGLITLNLKSTDDDIEAFEREFENFLQIYGAALCGE